MSSERQPPVIAVVGPCTSGKSTVVKALRARGYTARMPAQEHSYVQDMWQQMVDPDLLIYLDVSYAAARQRRTIHWGPERLEKEAERLAHARQHADLYIDTDNLTPDEVLARVLAYITGDDTGPA